ncbi:hypothetical protein A6V36_18025 [Paraburkholderia ginsengiterrae]|uniref:Uncharacterized protein n=1 Tax=Paraburkholderia ginsengiterrae TaxID=1462993 RepID=A0A1A9MXB3_9BURK|nr:restriction endonuclease [Paraburkholderia ginsengiterrae]OAJ52031.1 hypothetical protein A6V37_10205 [Paraburkholderia ginsengiterrae]OAJ63392.1 hypothetical protein A6V36_18025 [Paraburkholderia ginsengiterrae]
MQPYRPEIRKPLGEADFEQLCANVYGAVFKDPLPSINGRSGQSQHGIDVLVRTRSERAVAIQCKRYDLKALTPEVLEEDIRKLDASTWDVGTLIFATTAERDTHLLQWTEELSSQRMAESKFAVQVEFWGDICNHICAHDSLRQQYAPTPDSITLAAFRDAQQRSDKTASRITSLIETLVEAQNGRRKNEEIYDEHGRMFVNAKRSYVLNRPIVNSQKLGPYAILLCITGMGIWFTCGTPFILHHPPYWFGFLGGLSMMMAGVMLIIVCYALRQRMPTLASPFDRGLLFEADARGDVYLTRIFASCPKCGSSMRYKFVGPLKGPLEPRLVCPRFDRAHSSVFDFTSMPDAGSDLPGR